MSRAKKKNRPRPKKARPGYRVGQKARKPRSPTRRSDWSFPLVYEVVGDAHREDDDCPWCRAAAELGIRSGQIMNQELYEAYRRRAEELAREESLNMGVSWPTQWSERTYERVTERLHAEGYRTDLENLDDVQFARTLRRAAELWSEVEGGEDAPPVTERLPN